MSEPATKQIDGVQFTADECQELFNMMQHPGFQHYQRLLAAMQEGDVGGTLGNINCGKIEAFLHAQGSFCLAEKQLREWPDLVRHTMDEFRVEREEGFN